MTSELTPIFDQELNCWKIPLVGSRGHGKYALVDEQDLEEVSKRSWRLTANGYVSTHNKVETEGRYGGNLLLQRYILDVPFGAHIRVKFKNGNKLDNRRANLQYWSSPEQRACPYKGVHWVSSRNVYYVRLREHGKETYIGCAKTAEEGHSLLLEYLNKANEQPS